MTLLKSKQKSDKKPLIVCGNFNVSHESLDVYDGNLKNEYDELGIGFKDELKSDFDDLMGIGLLDALRVLYPHAIRHTFCSRCFESDMNLKVVQALSFLIEKRKITGYNCCSK